MVDLDVELVVLPLLDRVDQVVVDRLPVRLARAGGVRLGIELRQDVAARPVSMRSAGMTLPGERLAGRAGRRSAGSAREKSPLRIASVGTVERNVCPCVSRWPW